jgi:hypothetical protein
VSEFYLNERPYTAMFQECRTVYTTDKTSNKWKRCLVSDVRCVLRRTDAGGRRGQERRPINGILASLGGKGVLHHFENGY